MKIRVLGLDPGKTNMGFGAVELELDSNGEVKPPVVLAAGKLESPVNSLLNADQKMQDFLGEVWSLYAEHACTHIAIERFQNRGATSAGDTIEVVAFMIGALQAHTWECFGAMTVIPASQWKNRVKRRGLELKALYVDRTRYMGEPHELDAVLIACYGAQVQLGVVPEYAFKFKPIVEQINEKSTCLETRNRIAKAALKQERQLQRLQQERVKKRVPVSRVRSRSNSAKRKR